MARPRRPSDIFTRRTDPDEPDVTELVPGVRVFSVKAGPPRPVHKDVLPAPDPPVLRRGRRHRRHRTRPVRRDPRALLAVRRRRTSPETAVGRAARRLVPHARAREGRREPRRPTGAVVPQARRSPRHPRGRPDHRADRYRARSADRAVRRGPRRGSSSRLPVSTSRQFTPGDRAAAKQRFGFSDDPLVVFVGRLQPFKGTDIAVDAMAHLKRMVPDAQLAIVGGDSPRGSRGERMRLRLAARRLGVSDRLRFMEPVAHTRAARSSTARRTSWSSHRRRSRSVSSRSRRRPAAPRSSRRQWVVCA